jgi:hypothetical protein
MVGVTSAPSARGTPALPRARGRTPLLIWAPPVKWAVPRHVGAENLGRLLGTGGGIDE